MINDTKRIYGKVRDIRPEELIGVFRELEDIKAAVLFGSRANLERSPLGSRSDYDFAVLMDKTAPSDWGPLAKARVAIGQKLQLADTDFDVVDLEIAGHALKESIREQFLTLKGNEDDIRRLLG